MAVTISAGQLAVRLRVAVLASDIPLGFEDDIRDLLAVGRATVEQRAPLAPDAIQNEALTRFCAYLLDKDPATRGMNYANAWGNSGAASIVAPWIDRRAEAV